MSIPTDELASTMGRTVTVTTNDPKQPKLKLRCEGKVLVPMRVNPKAASFGNIRRSAGPKSVTIRLARGDGGKISPRVLNVSRKEIETSIRENRPGESYDLEVSLKPPWPNSWTRSTIILATGVKEVPKHTIPVVARIMPRVWAVPERFIAPHQTNEAQEESVVVMWHKNAAQKVIEATADDPRLEVRIEPDGDKQRLILKMPAGFEAGKDAASVILRTDDEEVSTLEVPIVFRRKGR
ncbi:MAG: hypothetical protein JSU63_12775 [Phycisphaerales bacterium]|nr:MAG: hypothetical protein JSU63_12775 [Phycisphaerales bacterium]